VDTLDINDNDLKSFYEIVSKNVIRIRKNKNVSQLDLATSIGHTSATFLGKAEILAENRHFNMEHIYKIALVLNVDINEFFKGINTTS
jgi:putative transcriptional regulator